MQRHDPYILTAMDGREANHPNSAPSKDEPTAFFYVVFGLVYEALAQASTDSASSVATRDATITALQALTSLVSPEYAGSAVLEPTIFEEFSNLCYRMAMTEPPEVQVHLVAAVSSFVNSQCRRTNTPRYVHLVLAHLVTNVPFSQRKLSELPLDSPINQCLRICAHILKQAIPSSREALSGRSSSSQLTGVLIPGLSRSLLRGQDTGAEGVFFYPCKYWGRLGDGFARGYPSSINRSICW